jgi:hypothetical protein
MSLVNIFSGIQTEISASNPVLLHAGYGTNGHSIVVS